MCVCVCTVCVCVCARWVLLCVGDQPLRCVRVEGLKECKSNCHAYEHAVTYARTVQSGDNTDLQANKALVMIARGDGTKTQVLEKGVAGGGVPAGACVRKVVRMALPRGECTRGQCQEGFKKSKISGVTATADLAEHS
jgi:hypothetical protein